MLIPLDQGGFNEDEMSGRWENSPIIVKQDISCWYQNLGIKMQAQVITCPFNYLRSLRIDYPHKNAWWIFDLPPTARPAHKIPPFLLVLHTLTNECRKPQPSEAGRLQGIFSDREFQFHLYIQIWKLTLHWHQCSQAFAYVNETIPSQSHNTGQDAALQQPCPYPKAWHTLSSTPELVYCTWQSTARLYTIIITQTERRDFINSGFGHFKEHKRRIFTSGYLFCRFVLSLAPVGHPGLGHIEVSK